MTEAEKIKKLKREIKDLKLKVEHENQRGIKYLQYSLDLEAKLQVAIDRLRLISVNSYYSNEGQETNTPEYNNQVTASRGLAMIGAMKARKP